MFSFLLLFFPFLRIHWIIGLSPKKSGIRWKVEIISSISRSPLILRSIYVIPLTYFIVIVLLLTVKSCYSSLFFILAFCYSYFLTVFSIFYFIFSINNFSEGPLGLMEPVRQCLSRNKLRSAPPFLRLTDMSCVTFYLFFYFLLSCWVYYLFVFLFFLSFLHFLALILLFWSL